MIWVVAAVGFALHFAVADQNHKLNKQRQSVNAMLRHLPEDSTWLSIQAPNALVLADKTNPTRYQMFSLGLDKYVDDTWPGGLAGYAAWIGRQQPTVIVIDKKTPPHWLRPTLDAGYVKVGRAPRMTWYVNKSVGEQTLHKLHRRV
jgi:hypothetical protein